MKIQSTSLNGLFLVQNSVQQDIRGFFHKPYSFLEFDSKGLNTDFKEIYYSVNRKNVIRGMHFQSPPFELSKLVFVTSGSILDVVLDIRKNSTTFGKVFSIILNTQQGLSLYIPVGFAHGFLSLEDTTIVNYAQTAVYSRENDIGIRYNSFGFPWGISNPIISRRDSSFPLFEEYDGIF